MQRALVMTVLGQDRPGLVDSVAAIIAEHGGNWLESRMSRLGGHFAGILRVEVPPDKESAVVQKLNDLSSKGLQVVVHTDQAPATSVPHRLSLLEIVGDDRPGIVRQISHALAEHGVNVEDLHTERSSAAMTGEMIFWARAHLSLPENANLSEIRQQLERIAEDLIVTIKLEPLPPAS